MKVRTRFAPSPTGYMHIGNLRTALYAYLFAKHEKGSFILRIEDTDQKRFVEGATEVIYNTLKQTGLIHDEGPDKDKGYGPYVQSERKEIYKEYAEKLVKKGHAYYCFCSNHEDTSSEDAEETTQTFGYNRKCRNLSKEEVEKNLKEGKRYVIRQKMPLDGTTTFHDEVYGDITVENSSLDDQILLKSDGMPTYNFANVVDDHLMKISHVIRGKEYISSTPKYQLLYQAFGWKPPKTVHLSTIMGQNPDGTVSKLSKRHGSVSFANLVDEGYLVDAIINYIALLGWSPKMEREVFSLPELVKLFNLDGIVKTNAIFDYKKLDWFNAIYIQQMTHEDFIAYSQKYIANLPDYLQQKWEFASTLAQSRINKFSDIVPMFKFLDEYKDFDLELFENKKNKLDKQSSKEILCDLIDILKNIEDWSVQNLNQIIQDYTMLKEYKIGKTMWPIRIAVTGEVITPGGGAEMLYLLGKEESVKRITKQIQRLS
ncbi:MAG: glutamate--tRNA ligase [Clostridia bacterium]|nr:glutamate--tRNA ligase [Clostridia bacterium]